MGLPPDTHVECLRTQISDNPGYNLNTPNSRSDAAVPTLLNANEVRIKDSTLSMTVTNSIPAATKPALGILYKRVAPHAILNKGGRGEDAKCHPGTRTELIGIVEKWMGDVNGEPMFWMSGPAGGGKTAIMKTIAERSTDRGAPTINFFFFRGDATRTSARSFVATLLYQLLRLYPSCATVSAEIFSDSPRILDESLDEQCKLISALFPIIQQSAQPVLPIVLLIDGLDECDTDGENAQPDILRALERVVTQAESPFRLLVASRQEARIQMAFNGLPSRARSIFLSEEYSPENDIRMFVEAEFTRIKASHPGASSLPRHWPSSADVHAIVAKSSGQFIYAATVMRYVSDPYMAPTLSLEQVMGIVSTVHNSPFASLDNIYMFILNRASDRDATRDLLSVKLVGRRFSHIDILSHYNTRYNRPLIDSCISKLSSIVKLDEDGDIQFYHASLTDFLVDCTRSEAYWIDTDAFNAKLVVVFWRKHLANYTFSDAPLYNQFIYLQKPHRDVTQMLLSMSLKWMLSDSRNDLLLRLLESIKNMYYYSDIKTYKQILRRVIFMALSRNANITRTIHDIPHAQEYISYFQRWMWWSRLLCIFRRKRT